MTIAFSCSLLVWAFDIIEIDMEDPLPFDNTPLLFGARVQDVLEGARPALANCTLHVKFIHNQPLKGQLPDLVQLVTNPTEDQQLLKLGFFTSVLGELHDQFGVEDGSLGLLRVAQFGLFDVPEPGYLLEQVRITALNP